MATLDELPPTASRSADVATSEGASLDPSEIDAARRLDLLLVVVVGALAFLLASFPARNSDLWRHLAAGRLLAQGEFAAATGPQLPPDLRVNHAWLYDLLCYAAYSAVGGPGLVLLKALLVVGLALLLLRLSRTGREWWAAAACTALALLAMSVRLLLQPVCVSYLFLALTLWFLEHPRLALAPVGPAEERTTGRLPLKSYWPLLPLFALWANVDAWFVLGPFTVGLYLVGEPLQSALAPRHGTPGPDRRLALSLALAGGLAACLLNPHFASVFPSMAELGLTGAAVLSPFQLTYFRSGLGASPAGLAYFLLVLLGVGSLAVNARQLRWGPALVWLVLFLLSAYQARTVPFFAVVAGPVLAWNLQEYLARRTAAASPRPAWLPGPIVGRRLTLALGLALLVCAWPGWLQVPPFEPRRWTIELPPSLEGSAAATQRWLQRQDPGPAGRGLHLSPETANAFAWFCPEDKGVLDEQLASVFRGEVSGSWDPWAERLRSAGINHLIVYDSDQGRLSALLAGLSLDPVQWPLLYEAGEVAVFGWRDPLDRGKKVDGAFASAPLDLERLAFGPSGVRKAPRTGPAREPEAREWWEAFYKPTPPRLLDRDEATLHVLHAKALLGLAPLRHQHAWEASQWLGLIGAAGPWAGSGALMDTHVRLALFQPPMPKPDSGLDDVPAVTKLVQAYHQGYRLRRDEAPPALLYLAVRAARSALAVNPDDAQAYLVLGESYLQLLHNTRERIWSKQMPELLQLRRAQASTALNQALVLKPDLAPAHFGLSGLYREIGCLDLALKHLQAYQKLTRQADELELARLAQVVEDRRDQHLVMSAGKSVLERATMAVDQGLAGKARDLLLESDFAAFGPAGMRLELELLLQTGRARDVREWTTPELEVDLGPPAYHWLRGRALAATGDYASAEEECAELGKWLAAADRGQQSGQHRQAMSMLGSSWVLDSQPGQHLVQRLVGGALFHTRVTHLARNLRQRADVLVVRGLLSLEEGAVDDAAEAFGLALALCWQDQAAGGRAGGLLEFNGRAVARGYLAWLE
jgi:tetratricopeptide (TPR) repeat protein